MSSSSIPIPAHPGGGIHLEWLGCASAASADRLIGRAIRLARGQRSTTIDPIAATASNACRSVTVTRGHRSLRDPVVPTGSRDLGGGYPDGDAPVKANDTTSILVRIDAVFAPPGMGPFHRLVGCRVSAKPSAVYDARGHEAHKLRRQVRPIT